MLPQKKWPFVCLVALSVVALGKYLSSDVNRYWRGAEQQLESLFTEAAENLPITPPSAYNAYSGPKTTNPTGQTKPPQDKFVWEFLKSRKNGTFVEMGALDGVSISNTLWLEREQGWSGLLIEANPELCKALKRNQRHSWVYCGCLSSTPQNLTFVMSSIVGGLLKYMDPKHIGLHQKKMRYSTVQCRPPSPVFNACFDPTKPIHIDYFSLDVEGAEIQVLETLRAMLKSRQMVVEVWSIEYRTWDGKQIVKEGTRKNLQDLRAFFKSLGGYNEVGLLGEGKINSDDAGLDVIFSLSKK